MAACRKQVKKVRVEIQAGARRKKAMTEQSQTSGMVRGARAEKAVARNSERFGRLRAAFPFLLLMRHGFGGSIEPGTNGFRDLNFWIAMGAGLQWTTALPQDKMRYLRPVE
jgi:hypothetical protein